MAGLIYGAGPVSWSGSRDKDGQLEYKIKHLVECDPRDGPDAILRAAGLPRPGSTWRFGNDNNPYVYCRPDAVVSIYQPMEGDPATLWSVEQTFSTQPINRCQDTSVQDPLLEPMKVSGTFVKFKEEATKDRFDRDITNSSHEQIRGPQNEWDDSRPSVKIEQNLATLDLPILVAFRDTLNDSPLWGLSRRMVKLSNVSWERKFYGSCNVYYTRSLEFDTDFRTFDRDVRDEGTRVLQGRWGSDGRWQVDDIIGVDDDGIPVLVDENNPSHFMRAVDRQNNPCKVILDGHGVPYDPTPMVTTSLCAQCPSGAAASWTVEGNFDLAADVVLTIANTSGCTWTGSNNSVGTMTLSYGTIFSFTASVYSGVWNQVGTWNCKGTNTLVKANHGTGPGSISLVPVGGAQPGSRHIEKYLESNFLLLRIPLVL